MVTCKEFLEYANNYEFPDDAVVSRGSFQNFKSKEDIQLVGYSWQSKVDFLNQAPIMEWSYEFPYESVFLDTREQVISYVTVTISCKDGVMYFSGVGTCEYKYNKNGTLNFGLSIKSAENDAFSRACSKFGLGLKAYKGKEIRQETPNFKIALENVRNKKNYGLISIEKFQQFLYDYGFPMEEKLPMLEGVPTTIKKGENEVEMGTIDFSILSDQNCEELYYFIKNNHPLAITMQIINHMKSKGGESTNSSIGVFRKLANKYGNKLLEKMTEIPDSVKPNTTNWTRYLESMCQEKSDLDEETQKEINEIGK